MAINRKPFVCLKILAFKFVNRRKITQRITVGFFFLLFSLGRTHLVTSWPFDQCYLNRSVVGLDDVALPLCSVRSCPDSLEYNSLELVEMHTLFLMNTTTTTITDKPSIA